ncbi:MAG: amidohydrolase [Clostridiales Family XIII bacterium]|jgi:predicted amidohydrolase YtcJ|nr:amidohydrolase [Clostridiales Family XIII bacterium]
MNNKKWSPAAELVIKNVKIYTVDITIDEIKAGKQDFTVIGNGYVASKDGKTIAVGEGAPDSALIGPDTKVIDGGGKTLVPGLMDSHMHAMFAGTELMSVNFKDAKSKGDFMELLKAKVAETPDDKWVRGCEWNELVWDVKEAPTKLDLDQASTEQPIMCCRLCHHVYVVNSKALELAGITKDTPDPDGGKIGRDENGEPNGLLYENSAMGLIDDVIPDFTEEEFVQAIEGIGKVMNSYGLTSVIDANMTFDQMRAYKSALDQGRLTYRENMMFYLDKAWGDVDYHLKRISEMTAVTGFGNDMLKFNGIKVTLDGIPATGTAAMREPYEHMPETSGDTTITEEEMIEVAKLSAKYNWQIGIHCCGDRTADVSIKSFIEAYKINPGDWRHYIIHHAVYRDDQLPLMKEYNIGVTSQPTIGMLMGEQPLIGAEMTSRYQRSKVFIDAGIVFGGSTDCPIVTSNPFTGIYAAMTRLDADGNVYCPEDKLTAAQGLIMWTKASAWFSHDDEKLGSIDVGYLADYALIDTDILEAEPEAVRDTKVLCTVLGGKVVYEA